MDTQNTHTHNEHTQKQNQIPSAQFIKYILRSSKLATFENDFFY